MCDNICITPNTVIIQQTNSNFNKVLPLTGVAGRGRLIDPIVGTNYYEHPSLIGLGTNKDLKLEANGILMYGYGSNQNFSYNNNTGRITFTLGFEWINGGTFWIDLNQ